METRKTNAGWEISAETVAQVFVAAVQRTPDAPYCKGPNGALTYGQAAGAVQALADELGDGICGQPVALILPNSNAFLIAYFAILFAGGKPALINYGHPDATIRKLLDDLQSPLVISDREFDGFPTRRLDDLMLKDLVQPVKPEPFKMAGDAAGGGGDVAAILYSGGTTGLPKQVPHTNTAIIATMERGDWGWRTQENETWLPVAPFTHIYGYLMGLVNPIIKSGAVVIPDRFHPDLIVDLLMRERVSIFGGGPPAIYQAVMAAQKFSEAKFPHLRICPGGGAPFPLEVHKRWHAATGLKIYEGYGMTEIAPISVNTEEHGIKPGSAGKPVPDTLVQIVDLETGTTVLPAGQTGEIRVQGPHMMTGYVCSPEETDLTLKHGFVYTGDIGTLDDQGFLTISDRKKNVIFVSGFNVFPREIEELLLTHPAISGACVVGAAHPRSGEVPIAFVTLRADVSAAQILDFCRENLIAYKLPTQVNILSEMPLTPAGKVDRMALQDGASVV